METLNDTYETPLIKLVNKILIKAFQEEVSEIQIEPQENFLRVNFLVVFLIFFLHHLMTS